MGARYGRIVVLCGVIAAAIALMFGASLAISGTQTAREASAPAADHPIARYATFGLWTKRAVRL